MQSDPVVLVHGLFGPFNDPAAAKALSPAPVSAPHLPGYGPMRGIAVSLESQVRALEEHIQTEHAGAPVHLVGHSIGAVFAFQLAASKPGLVRTITTVEGNFSLADAFWSRSIALLEPATAQTEITARLQDPAAFLASDLIAITPRYLQAARMALAYQPWKTVWQSARAIVGAIASPDYEVMLQRVFAAKAVHLIAGERSARDWHVPAWAHAAAASSAIVPDVGHMMMLEDPAAVARALRAALRE
jgi:lipase